MCTAITFQGKRHYFGRNLDLDHSYSEEVVITPRRFPLSFHKIPALKTHLALIGMATISKGYPLYYDATNEAGLSMAGLNFPENAVYDPPMDDAFNIAPYELIPYLLGSCKSVDEALALLRNANIAAVPFSEEYPLAPLHWILADREKAVTIESTCRGLEVFENPYGVLTNNPPFPYHCQNIRQYLHLTSQKPENQLAPQLPLSITSQGLGALGLPGDLSSPSRFVRAVFTKWNAQSVCSQESDLPQFFHILRAVAFTAGCVLTPSGSDKTIYSSCCDTQDGIYYYTTYENSQINAVSLKAARLDADSLLRYPLQNRQNIFFQN